MSESKRISLTICEACQKIGIDYNSVNPTYIQMMNDAKRLGQIYSELKIIAGDLQAISERNNIEGLKDILKDDISLLDKCEHDIIKIAKKIKENDK